MSGEVPPEYLPLADALLRALDARLTEDQRLDALTETVAEPALAIGMLSKILSDMLATFDELTGESPGWCVDYLRRSIFGPETASDAYRTPGVPVPTPKARAAGRDAYGGRAARFLADAILRDEAEASVRLDGETQDVGPVTVGPPRPCPKDETTGQCRHTASRTPCPVDAVLDKWIADQEAAALARFYTEDGQEPPAWLAEMTRTSWSCATCGGPLRLHHYRGGEPLYAHVDLADNAGPAHIPVPKPPTDDEHLGVALTDAAAGEEAQVRMVNPERIPLGKWLTDPEGHRFPAEDFDRYGISIATPDEVADLLRRRGYEQPAADADLDRAERTEGAYTRVPPSVGNPASRTTRPDEHVVDSDETEGSAT